MKGFRDFILRGNVVELAVAVIIALALKTVVDAFVVMVMDVVGKLGGTPDFSNYAPGGVHVGLFITAIISFLIVAAVVYFLVVVPYNKLKDRVAQPAETPAVPADIVLLTEIRDLLQDRQATP